MSATISASVLHLLSPRYHHTLHLCRHDTGGRICNTASHPMWSYVHPPLCLLDALRPTNAVLSCRYVGLANDPEHAHNYRDAVELGDCDAGTRRLCQLLGWEEELVAACDALGLVTPAMH